MPNFKRIRGGPWKNGQKSVDLTWNDPFFVQGSKQKFGFMYFGRFLLCALAALLSVTNQQHITTTDGTMGDDLRTSFAILAAEKSWKQFKLTWKVMELYYQISVGTGNPA